MQPQALKGRNGEGGLESFPSVQRRVWVCLCVIAHVRRLCWLSSSLWSGSCLGIKARIIFAPLLALGRRWCSGLRARLAAYSPGPLKRRVYNIFCLFRTRTVVCWNCWHRVSELM